MTRALIIDVALVAGFGVQHSFFAALSIKQRVRTRWRLDPITFRGVQSLLNAAYILLAAVLWQDVGVVVWDLDGLARTLVLGVLAVGWVSYFYLHLFEYDCGLAFGSTAVVQRRMGRPTAPPAMWACGSRRWIRFPVHTAFFPMFFAVPRMTLSTLVLAIVANLYNVVGTVLYDRRLEKLVKQPYFDYQRHTALLLFPFRAPRGASPLGLPRPRHWTRPLHNLGGVIVGAVAGGGYAVLLGTGSRTAAGVLAASAAAVAAGVVGGALLGAITRRLSSLAGRSIDDHVTWGATNSALVSAVALGVWAIICLAVYDRPPHPALVLPMWVTTLWLGHVVILALNAGSDTAPSPSVAVPVPARAS